METYRIVRFYFSHPREIVRGESGLTLEQAQAHCSDPESSSATCRQPSARERTHRMGPWFEGYEKE